MLLPLATISVVPIAAAGWAFLYYLLGGGVGGAIVLFLLLKAFRR